MKILYECCLLFLKWILVDLCNLIPKGDMKPDLNQTQAIYRPEVHFRSKIC